MRRWSSLAVHPVFPCIALEAVALGRATGVTTPADEEEGETSVGRLSLIGSGSHLGTRPTRHEDKTRRGPTTSCPRQGRGKHLIFNSRRSRMGIKVSRIGCTPQPCREHTGVLARESSPRHGKGHGRSRPRPVDEVGSGHVTSCRGRNGDCIVTANGGRRGGTATEQSMFWLDMLMLS